MGLVSIDRLRGRSRLSSDDDEGRRFVRRRGPNRVGGGHQDSALVCRKEWTRVMFRD